MEFNSTSDMLSAIPADIMGDLAAPPVADAGGSGQDEGYLGNEPDDAAPEDDGVIDDSPAGDEPVDEADEQADEEPAGETADEEPVADAKAAKDDAKPAEDLPEGVSRGKDRSGKPGLFVKEARWEVIHGNHKLAQDAAALIGEPLTLDALRTRDAALVANDRLWNDLASGDASVQGDVVDAFLQQMKSAVESGEVAGDPSISFATVMYEKLRDSAPDAYASLRLQAAKDLMSEMYAEAASLGNVDLSRSMNYLAMQMAGVKPKDASMTPEQYVDYARSTVKDAGLPFYGDDELPALATKPVPAADPRDRRIAELEAKINQGTQGDPAAQHKAWRDTHVKEVNTGLFDDAIKPALATVEKSWEKFPQDYERLVVKPLHSEVRDVIRKDAVFSQKVGELQARAQRAASAEVRTRIGDQIRQAFVNRGKLAVEQVKGPILQFAADSLKGRSETTHQRREGAQQRTAPKGSSAPVRTSAVPDIPQFANNTFDPKVAASQAAKYLASLRN
jgi:hypothetical protein